MSELFGSIATDSTSYGDVDVDEVMTCYRFFIVNIALTVSEDGTWDIGAGILAILGGIGLRTSGHTSSFCKCMRSSEYALLKLKMFKEGITEGIKKTKKGGVTYYSGIETEKLYQPCDYYTQCRCYRNNDLKGRDNNQLHSGSGCWVTSTGDCREMSGSADDVMQDIVNTERQNACDCS